MTLRPPATVLLAAILLVGGTLTSASAKPDKVYASAMQARMQYRGFSVTRPTPAGWYLVGRDQTQTHALFRRDLPVGTHTAYLSVDLQALPEAPASQADFSHLARQDGTAGHARFTPISYHQKAVTIQGQWAIEFDHTYRDNAPASGSPLTVHATGRVIRQPTFPNGVVVITVSERGEPADLSPAIQAEGRAIAEGVQLESAPGQPLR